MSYQRLYPQRIGWEDEPSLATPINQVNLNKMDSALYGIDGRVVELDENKVGKTETFNTSRNGVVPKPTQADITAEKVLRADGAWVEQSGGGGGGGGHTYVDKDDNQMPPRGKAKFTGGLNLTDDSENNRTIVDDNYEIIPWATWQDYSDAEKAQHPNAIVTGAPDCDGTLEIEVVHLAWTNPSPTSAFPQSGGSNAISLDTDDYDLYYATAVVSGGDYVVSNIVPKGKRIEFSYNQTTPNNYTVAKNRTISYTSATVLIASDCLTQPSNGARSTDNTALVPYQIFTIKCKATAKIKAIAHDVSTSASKCMLDENTSVADAINNRAYSKLGFTAITGVANAKAFCTAVCADLATKLTQTNQMVNIGYVWGGVDVFIGCATVRDTGHIYGFLSSASSGYALYTFVYTVASGTARITQITGTSL